jgi:hypothetical protein
MLTMTGLTEQNELQEILKAEDGTASSDADEGIRRSQAGPGERQRTNLMIILADKEEDAPVAPIIADAQDLKALSAPGVKRMGYFEELCCIRLTGCC